MKFLVTLTHEDGWFIVECPSLPGCVSQGRTKEEALTNIREAIELSLEVRAENAVPWPEMIEVEIDPTPAA
jgi:predicted RNase H-like HicB family nuclease